MSESKRQLLLISSSRIGGDNTYLQHAENDIRDLLNFNQIKTILFIPYAKKNFEYATNLMTNIFSSWHYKIVSIHTIEDPIEAVKNAEAIFIGGGNTFVLLKALYDKNLIDIIRKRVLIDGIPYIGCSAGTNVATRSIHATNDMPIVCPQSFDSLNLVPFNINPHYVKMKANGNNNCSGGGGGVSSMGRETRDKRLIEFITYNNLPVFGLRDENSLKVIGNTIKLCGNGSSRLFTTDFKTIEYTSGSDISFLIENATITGDNDLLSN